MAQQAVEVILVRQLASHLASPTLVVDAEGDLVFFNEAAEPILGRRFAETGPILRGEWTAAFKPTHEDGTPIKREETLLYIPTDLRRPTHQRFWIQGMDGVARKLEALAFPLEGQAGRNLGAMAIFWELNGS